MTEQPTDTDAEEVTEVEDDDVEEPAVEGEEKDTDAADQT
jgi:hypothetical protein